MNSESQRKCDNCGRINKIIKYSYPAADGWDNSCDCAYCGQMLFPISRKSFNDYVAYKTEQKES
ncbi:MULTISPECIES: hypothetical protein [Lactiplantibacillus]|jgi:hypothetical protein|uniref:hypothetical protein n=1 Tax=Lactiplantibacillus TaxID=2767842 RepID=UPI00112D36FB|nr:MULTISPECIES: hypothetical protein [Lactiplantibacillus]MCS8604798.1 hypothetical protein [Lactiplantibacillus pentosus]TPV67404.1 hypothetical protein FJ911_01870 [Lactiplantibacillus plantarum]